MRKLLAMMVSAAMLVSMTACQTQNTHSPGEPSGATMTVALSHSYSAKQLLPGQNFGVHRAVQFGEQLLVKCWVNGSTAIAILDPDAGELTAQQIVEDNCFIHGLDVQGDTVDLFLGYCDDEWKEVRREIVTYDASLNEVQRKDVTAAFGAPLSVGAWARDAQGNEYLGIYGNGILCQKTDGTLQKIEGTQGNEELFKGRDGNVYGISADNDKSIDVYDAEALTRQKIDIDLPKSGYNNARILPGNANFDYLCYQVDDLYGVTIADGSVTKLINWEESDFTGDRVSYAYQLQDGRFIIMDFSLETMVEPYATWLLTARTQEELDSMALISMASLGSTSGDLVHQYNRQAQGHRIVLKSYADTEAGSYHSRKDELENDLINGIVPDILVNDSDLNYQKLSNKGLFEDLSVWMANDPEFHEDEYLMNFFASMKYKGRLERLSTRFDVDAWMAKTEFLGGKTGLTMADYFALDLPEGMALMGSNFDREMAFQESMYSQLGVLVDYENGTCRFDSPEFVQILELFGSLPAKRGTEDVYAFEENRALLFQNTFFGLLDYVSYVQTYFGNADVTLTGTPLEASGSGGVFIPWSGFMMVSSSEHKEEIWEFFKFCLSKENQMKSPSYAAQGFPVQLEALEAAFEKDRQPRGEMDTFSRMYGDAEVEIKPATKEQADELMTYIKGITTSAYADQTVRNIVSEEAGKYFAGDCTAEDAAKMMQSRVSLYLAEQS